MSELSGERLEVKQMGLFDKLGSKLKKWSEPSRQAEENEGEVTVSGKGVDILSWAAPHFENHDRVDLYLDEDESSIGIKPDSHGERKLSPKTSSRGLVVSCRPLMRQVGVEERRRVPAEWDGERGMLVLNLGE